MHRPRCPYRGNASSLRGSRPVHNKNLLSLFLCLRCDPHQSLLSAQKGTLCGIWELSKYLEVESSHVVTDYKNTLSMISLVFLCLSYLVPVRLKSV